MIELGLLQEAMRDLDHVEQVNPSNAESKYLRGVVAARRGEVEKAIQSFSEAIRIDGNNSEYYRARAEQLIALDRKSEALIDLNHAVQLNNANADAYVLRSGVQENFDAALADLTRAIRLVPDNPKYLLQRSTLFMEHGDEVLALADATAVIQLDSSSREPYLLRAEIYDRLGQTEKAEQEMEKALQVR